MSIILFEAIQRVQRLGRGLLRYISNELSGFDSSPLLSFEKDTKFYLIQSKGGFAIRARNLIPEILLRCRANPFAWFQIVFILRDSEVMSTIKASHHPPKNSKKSLQIHNDIGN
jgi:hypothetical protein